MKALTLALLEDAIKVNLDALERLALRLVDAVGQRLVNKSNPYRLRLVLCSPEGPGNLRKAARARIQRQDL